MLYVFGVCAAIGGTIMVCQVILLLFGLGDADHSGGDVHGDFDAAAHGGGHPDGHDAGADDGGSHHFSSDWLFGVVSFRTVMAALAFFGFAGLAGRQAQWSDGWTIGVAAAAGIAAMYIVHWVMLSLYRLRSDGTARIRTAIGKEAVVYLRIPGKNSGLGKVTVSIQGRTMEYSARTAGDAIPTGASVSVVRVQGADTLEVELAPQTEASPV